MTRCCYWNVNYITLQRFTIGLSNKYIKNVNITGYPDVEDADKEDEF